MEQSNSKINDSDGFKNFVIWHTMNVMILTYRLFLLLASASSQCYWPLIQDL